MGSPLGPVLANAFLCYYEIRWLEECPLSFLPIFFARYVDDIFVLLRSKEHIVLLAQYLSSKHPNIRFTYEEENKNVLPFLDVNVYRDANKFSSTVHRKDTFSGVYTNFDSFMPDTYQRGLISTLLYRAYAISSSYGSLHEEVENLKKIFAKNGYPTRFVDRCIFNFFKYFMRDFVVQQGNCTATTACPSEFGGSYAICIANHFDLFQSRMRHSKCNKKTMVDIY